MKDDKDNDPKGDKLFFKIWGNAYVIMSLGLPRIWEFVSDYHNWYNLITAILILFCLQYKE